MLSKCAASFLVLLPVLVFAERQRPASGSQAARGASQPQVGLQGALPLAHPGPFSPSGQLRRPPFSPWGKTRMRQNFGHPGIRPADLPSNRIFLTAPTYGSGGYGAESVEVEDVNGDGKPDLVVANQCSDSACMNHGFVGVLLGKGDGTFQPVRTYDSGGYGAFSVAVVDVNHDGKPDLVVANVCANSNCTNGGVGVLLGNGDGTFQAAISYVSGGKDAYSVAVEDVNGDSKPDLLVTNYCADSNCSTDGSVSVLLGNGDGTFRAAVTYGSGGFHAVSVSVGDVNGDGKPDLLVTNNCVDQNCATGNVGVLLGHGNGTFQAAVTYATGGEEPESAALADVNGDGKLDLLVANAICAPGCATGGVGVLLGNGDGSFQSAVTYHSGGFGAESAAAMDVNGDGKPDLLVANTCVTDGAFNCVNGSVGVLLGNGDGTFQAAVSYGSDGTGAASVAVRDVNGDGNPDVLVANACGNNGNYGCMIGSVGVLLGNGNGTFRAAVNDTTGGYEPDSVAVGDVNGDGNPDLVVTSQCDNSGNCNGVVGVLLGNGDGAFQPVVTYDSGGYQAQSVAVADLNGDGKSDLVVANACANSNCTNGGVVGVLLSNGDGTFQSAMSYASVGQVADSVAVADVNGDGKLDLVVANGDGSVGGLLGNGDGTFPIGDELQLWRSLLRLGGGGEPERGWQARSRGGKFLCQQRLREWLGGSAAWQWGWNLPGGGSLQLGRVVYRCRRSGGFEQGWQAGFGACERICDQFRNEWLGGSAVWRWGWNISGGNHYIHAHSAWGSPVTRPGGLRRRRQAGFGRGCWQRSAARKRRRDVPNANRAGGWRSGHRGRRFQSRREARPCGRRRYRSAE